MNRLKEFTQAEESPADRDLRRMRGLSAEVGSACTAWLTARGIKSRSWGTFQSRVPRER